MDIEDKNTFTEGNYGSDIHEMVDAPIYLSMQW